jgi:hypothetical protein
MAGINGEDDCFETDCDNFPKWVLFGHNILDFEMMEHLIFLTVVIEPGVVVAMVTSLSWEV